MSIPYIQCLYPHYTKCLSTSHAKIFHSHGLPLTLRKRTFLDKFHTRREQYFIFQLTSNTLSHIFQLRIIVGAQSVQFHLHSHDIVVILSIERNQIITAQSWELHKNLFYLHREHVDTFNDEHVICTTFDTVNAPMRSSARARFRDDTSQITGTITQQRHHCTIERSEHHFTNFPIRNRFQSVRVDNFNNIAILPEMHAILLFAFESHTRSVHLGHTKTIIGFDAKHAFDAAALFIRMRLSTDKQSFQTCCTWIYALLLEHLSQTNGITGNR